jgi:hypothetical protein
MTCANARNSKGVVFQILAGICLFFVPGCGDIGVSPEPLQSISDGKHMMLSNATPDTLYYFLCPTALLPIVDWVPCTDPQNCSNRVLPHSTKILDLESFWWVQREGDFDEITVCWWKLVRRTDGSYGVDQVNYERTPIR